MTPSTPTPFALTKGEGPLLISVPHASTFVPDAIAARLNATGRMLTDADWHIDTMVAPLAGTHSLIAAKFHRYVIDANRDPSGASLYPGQATTELVPTTDFDGNPLWRDGEAPDEAEVAERQETFHAPYHAALAAELERVRARHGIAVLFDVHSIRSVVPRLFEGTLTPFNVGTDHTKTCAPPFEEAAVRVFGGANETVLNGRFRGGWTVRHHGRPAHNIHAVQIEIAQSLYMDEAPPFAPHDGFAATAAVVADAAAALAETAMAHAA